MRKRLDKWNPRLSLQAVRGIGLACLFACAGGSSATAQQTPSAMELLGKAQSKAERQAVEDLITKLQGRPGASQPNVPTPIATPPVKPADELSNATTANKAAPAKPPTEVAPVKTPPAAPAIPAAPIVAPAVSAAVAPAPMEPPASAAIDTALPSADIFVYFDFGSSAVDAKAAETLATLGRALSDARLAKAIFLIAGHTDAKGKSDYNLDLSQRRAESVRQHLITTYGLESSRLVALGFGDTRLKDPQNPLSDANRRVQVVNVSAFAQQ